MPRSSTGRAISIADLQPLRAAARQRSLSVAQVAERLDRRFHLLGGDHHRASELRHSSLRALIDWSHVLCAPDERLLWARLAVFPAPVDLETVEGVCGFGELMP